MESQCPYILEPVETDEVFVDQHEVLAYLKRKLNAGHSCAVIGGEGMGKTSILRRLERECQEQLQGSANTFSNRHCWGIGFPCR